MNELFDLFSSVETNTNSKPKENVYSGIIEARVRPNNEPFAEKTSVDQMTNDALELEIEKGEEMSMPTTPENHTVTEEPKAYSTEKILEAATLIEQFLQNVNLVLLLNLLCILLL